MPRYSLRPRLKRKIHAPHREGLTYLVKDEFTTDLGTGSVHLTGPTPGPGGPRTVIDVESKLSISSGKQSVSGGKATPVLGDPGLWYPSLPRAPGRIALYDFTVSTFGFGPQMGWDSSQTGSISCNGIYPSTSVALRVFEGGGDSAVAAAYVVGTNYKIVVVLRAAGAMYFVKGGAFTNWTLIWTSTTNSTAAVFACMVNHSSVYTNDFIRVPATLWLPVPTASDGFASSFGTTDGLGHAEATGVGSGGSGITWTQQVGTWTVSSAKAAAASLSGGNAFATVPGVTADVLCDIKVTRSAGVAGLVLRWGDSSNYIIAYHDGTNAKLDQVVAGVPVNKISAAATYSAGAVLRVDLTGTNGRLYYNSVLVGSTTSISALLTGTAHGVYSTDTGNQQDDFVLRPKGTSNEYSTLDNY